MKEVSGKSIACIGCALKKDVIVRFKVREFIAGRGCGIIELVSGDRREIIETTSFDIREIPPFETPPFSEWIESGSGVNYTEYVLGKALLQYEERGIFRIEFRKLKENNPEIYIFVSIGNVRTEGRAFSGRRGESVFSGETFFLSCSAAEQAVSSAV